MSAPPLFDLPALLELVARALPRVLGQIDRDPDSPTYGSCDRGRWLLRLHDVDSGVLQQTSLGLTTLARLVERLPERPAWADPASQAGWRALARAINRRTAALLERGGGWLDEYYPGERSYVATAFAGYAALRSALDDGDEDVVASAGLRRAAAALSARAPGPAANQDAGAAAFLALYAGTPHGCEEHAQAARRLARLDDPAASYAEYGGLDAGYLTVSLHFLACLAADGTAAAEAPLRRGAERIAALMPWHGALGGEIYSRSTSYALPFGLLRAARADPRLAAALGRLDLAATLAKIDDRYLAHYVWPSLLLAADDLAAAGPPACEPAPPPAWAPLAIDDLAGCRRGRELLLVNLAKGASLQLDTTRERAIDAGYRLRRGGEVYCSAVVDQARAEVSGDADGWRCRARVRFGRYRQLVATPAKTIALRLLALLGPQLGALFKRWLISQPRWLDGPLLERDLRYDRASGALEIDDRIHGLQPGDELSPAPAISPRLVPSARFDQPGEAATHHGREPLAIADGRAARRRTIRVDGDRLA